MGDGGDDMQEAPRPDHRSDLLKEARRYRELAKVAAHDEAAILVELATFFESLAAEISDPESQRSNP